MNPSNIPLQGSDDYSDDYYDQYVNCSADGGEKLCDRTGSLFLLLAACYAALLTAGALLLIDPPTHNGGSIRVSTEHKGDHKGDNSGGANIHDDNFDEEAKGTPYRALSGRPEGSLVGRRSQGGRAANSNSGGDEVNFDPQTIAALLQLPGLRLVVASFFFTAVAGVFCAGTYKSFAVAYFSNDK